MAGDPVPPLRSRPAVGRSERGGLGQPADSLIGLDVGGANLKAHFDGESRARPFALWREPDQLAAELKSLIAGWPSEVPVAATMTGELCDCFANRAEGVHRILEHVQLAIGGRELMVYQTSGRFADAASAVRNWPATSAANWHAIAAAAARLLANGNGLVIDIGSTTTDLVPVREGVPASSGLTDYSRLVHGELLYTGLTRTPVCAVVRSVRLGGRRVPVAAEWFATVQDARLVTGELAADSQDLLTADGRPADLAHASARLARCVCAEAVELGDAVQELARQVIGQQERSIVRAITKLADRCPGLGCEVLVAGAGEELASRCVKQALPEARLVCLSESIGSAASAAAAAWALAGLGARTARRQKKGPE